MVLLSLFIFLILFKFVLNYSHLLVSLLSLEFLSLVLFFNMFVYFESFFNESCYVLYFFVMMVCEGTLGLCLLVSSSYLVGVSELKSLNILLC